MPHMEFDIGRCRIQPDIFKARDHRRNIDTRNNYKHDVYEQVIEQSRFLN